MRQPVNSDPSLAQLVKAMPLPTLNPAELAAVRHRILTASAHGQSIKSPALEARNRFPLMFAAALAVLTISAGSFSLLRGNHKIRTASVATSTALSSEPRPLRNDQVRKGSMAHLQTHARVSFARVANQPDEIIRLDTGKLTVSVDPLELGQRFRVITGDAEVEVHGTAFDIESKDDKLTHVRVLHGIVEVRAQGGVPVFLSGGEEWRPTASRRAPFLHDVRPPKQVVRFRSLRASMNEKAQHNVAAYAPNGDGSKETKAPSVPLVAQVPAASVKQAANNFKSTVVSQGVGESDFQEGWEALVTGHPALAAPLFAQAAEAAQGAPLEEDADFWHGVSLARAGNSRAGITVLADFVKAHASSPRVGEASAMLGWLLLRSGDAQAARVRFKAAQNDLLPAVRDSAERGLAAIAKH